MSYIYIYYYYYKLFYLLGSLWEQLGSNPSKMGVSIEEYRQRIGCFVRVLSSFKVRGNNNTTYQKQSKDFGTALRVIIRCVDYAIKIPTMVIINTGYNNHAGHLYMLVQ